MSGNYFCHVCGGLVDLIKLQPSDVRLCECEKRVARLRAENNRLKAELAEAKKDAGIAKLKKAVAFNDQTSQHYLQDRTEARQQVQRQAALIEQCREALVMENPLAWKELLAAIEKELPHD